MRFRISRSVTNDIPLLHLHDDSGGVTISIAPDSGAMLHAFVVPLAEGPHNIIDNYLNATDLQENLSRSYKSSKLSPFACRINQAMYQWEGQDYEFANKFADGSAIHGLLFNKAFAVTEQVVTDFMASASFRYEYNAEDGGYPFRYACTITYTLLPTQTLQVQTTLENLDSRTIPIADGWHPYFNLGTKVDDCLLQFPAIGMLEFDDKLLPTGKMVAFDAFNNSAPVGSVSFDNCFVLEPGEQPVCVFLNPANGVGIRFHTDGNYPYLQIYIPPNRESMAIENLSAAPDAFNNKMGLLQLEPGKSQTYTLHYEVTVNKP